MTIWNDERKEELRRRWVDEKQSLDTIALAMRLTRGKVSGAIHRYGLPKRGRAVKSTQRPRAKKPEPVITNSNFNGRKINTKQVQFARPAAKKTRSEMEAMLREAVVNTRKMEE